MVQKEKAKSSILVQCTSTKIKLEYRPEEDRPFILTYNQKILIFVLKENSMYKTVVDNTPLIKVSSAKHEANYSVNGSLMNPLEAFYASLAACAAVYAKKACKELGIPAAGIEVDCKPFSGPGGPLSLARFRSEVHFPEHFTTDQKTKILDAIAHCAVKEIVMDGAAIEFQVTAV